MTIHVDLGRLAETLAQFDHAYLLTTSDAGAIKVNTVDPVVADGGIEIASAAVQARLNIRAHPSVTLVWPPRTFHGHTLIVDGRASFTDAAIVVAPEHAILHRPADHADGPIWADPDSCAEDCRSV